MPSCVAIIPARGGSKRIPRKNIKPFAGMPALGWPIRAAQDSGCFDRIIVSTDDAEIADVARACGAEVPSLRDATLADDHTGTTEVIRDAVGLLGLEDSDQVCCLYATALFVHGSDIKEGQRKLEDGASWVLSLAEYPTPIDRAYRAEGGLFVPRDADMMPKRSQDLAPAYFDVGQFYWAQAATWRDPAARVWDGAAGVVIPAERAIDIDTLEDWQRAERLAAVMGL